jgi:hypothetical protein
MGDLKVENEKRTIWTGYKVSHIFYSLHLAIFELLGFLCDKYSNYREFCSHRVSQRTFHQLESQVEHEDTEARNCEIVYFGSEHCSVIYYIVKLIPLSKAVRVKWIQYFITNL